MENVFWFSLNNIHDAHAALAPIHWSFPEMEQKSREFIKLSEPDKISCA